MTAMYPLRPIFELDQQIPLPECMYYMKNLHGQEHNGFLQAEKSYKGLNNIMEQVKRIILQVYYIIYILA
jgi:hypothetical protein